MFMSHTSPPLGGVTLHRDSFHCRSLVMQAVIGQSKFSYALTHARCCCIIFSDVSSEGTDATNCDYQND